MYGFLYITTNNTNGKKYLGACSYNKKNWRVYLGSGKNLRQAIKKYGINNFSREIILECETKEKLFQAEIEHIQKYNCVASRNWYNIAEGGYTTRGFSGKKHTQEHKEYMSNKFKGKSRPPHVGIAVGNSKRGKPRTVESKQKQSQTISGGNHHRALPVTINNITYQTLADAINKTGLTYYKIRKYYL